MRLKSPLWSTDMPPEAVRITSQREMLRILRRLGA
jgi:hypothetical protein